MYIYMCVYVFICIHTFTHIHLYIYQNVNIYKNVAAVLCIWSHELQSACVCKFVRNCVCACLCAHLRVCTCAHIFLCEWACVCNFVSYLCLYMCVNRFVCVFEDACGCVCCKCVCMFHFNVGMCVFACRTCLRASFFSAYCSCLRIRFSACFDGPSVRRSSSSFSSIVSSSFCEPPRSAKQPLGCGDDGKGATRCIWTDWIVAAWWEQRERSRAAGWVPSANSNTALRMEPYMTQNEKLKKKVKMLRPVDSVQLPCNNGSIE